MKKTSIILVGLFVIIFTSCELLIPCKDTEFTFSREENNSEKLHLAGYYYEYLSTEELIERDYLDIFVLNKNGVLYFIPGSNKEEVLSGNIKIGSPLSKPWCGIYRIYNDSIEIQYWKPELGWCSGAEVFKGIILNDSIFKITFQAEIRKRGDFRGEIERNIEFKFHQYSPKPDSVVSFIP